MKKNIIEIILASITILLICLLIYLISCHIIDEYIWYNCLEGRSIASLYMWACRQFNIIKNYVTI